jgi:hypothetical protein
MRADGHVASRTGLLPNQGTGADLAVLKRREAVSRLQTWVSLLIWS